MVTARPATGRHFLDEGPGFRRWTPAIAGCWASAGPRNHGARAGRRGLDHCRLARAEAPPRASGAALRADPLRPRARRRPTPFGPTLAWITAPARVTLTGPRTTVELRYDLSGVSRPGAYTGTVSGWGADSLPARPFGW